MHGTGALDSAPSGPSGFAFIPHRFWPVWSRVDGLRFHQSVLLAFGRIQPNDPLTPCPLHASYSQHLVLLLEPNPSGSPIGAEDALQ